MLPGFLARQVVADYRRGQAFVGDHAVLDGMADVDNVVGLTVGLRRSGPLVPFLDDLLVEDADLAYHQEPHVLHYVVGEGLVADVVAIDVQAEILPLDATPVGEVHLEVEPDPLFGVPPGAYDHLELRPRSQPLPAAGA